MIVNFICPDIWLNLLGVSCGCFWMRLTIELVDGVKHITLPNVDGPQLTSWRLEEYKRWDDENFAFSLFIFELKHQTFPVLGLGLHC